MRENGNILNKMAIFENERLAQIELLKETRNWSRNVDLFSCEFIRFRTGSCCPDQASLMKSAILRRKWENKHLRNKKRLSFAVTHTVRIECDQVKEFCLTGIQKKHWGSLHGWMSNYGKALFCLIHEIY